MRIIVNLIVLFLIYQITTGFFKTTLPRYREITAALQVRNAEQQKFDQIKTMGTFFEGLFGRPDIQSLALSKKYFEIYLPTDFKDYAALAILNSLLRQNNFPLRDINFTAGQIKPIPGVNLPNIKENKFKLTLEGRYNQITDLIKNIEQHSRVFNVDEIKIERDKNGLLKADLDITTYSLQPVDFP